MLCKYYQSKDDENSKEKEEEYFQISADGGNIEVMYLYAVILLEKEENFNESLAIQKCRCKFVSWEAYPKTAKILK